MFLIRAVYAHPNRSDVVCEFPEPGRAVRGKCIMHVDAVGSAKRAQVHFVMAKQTADFHRIKIYLFFNVGVVKFIVETHNANSVIIAYNLE